MSVKWSLNEASWGIFLRPASINRVITSCIVLCATLPSTSALNALTFNSEIASKFNSREAIEEKVTTTVLVKWTASTCAIYTVLIGQAVGENEECGFAECWDVEALYYPQPLRYWCAPLCGSVAFQDDICLHSLPQRCPVHTQSWKPCGDTWQHFNRDNMRSVSPSQSIWLVGKTGILDCSQEGFPNVVENPVLGLMATASLAGVDKNRLIALGTAEICRAGSSVRHKHTKVLHLSKLSALRVIRVTMFAEQLLCYKEVRK